jgi:Icc-related predicted phosphoesterase
MSTFISDIAFDIFLYFRLGNHHPNADKCVYYDMNNGSSTTIAKTELPSKAREDVVRVVVMSDSHEQHKCIGDIPPGDLFVHCGDIFMTNRKRSHAKARERLLDFNEWLRDIPCEHRIIVAGNHDKVIEIIGVEGTQEILTNASYLQNSFYRVNNLNIWATPLSTGHSGNRAFQSSQFAQETIRLVNEIPEDHVDMFISHGPCQEIARSLKPKLHLWGHAHGYHGVRKPGQTLWGQNLSCVSVNASIMDTRYNPTGLLVVVDVPVLS